MPHFSPLWRVSVGAEGKWQVLIGADVNSSDFNPQTCKLLRRINPSLSGKWQIAPVVCLVPERISPSVGAYYFDTRVGMYLFFLSQIDFL
jgi:hypothetical protein